MASKHKFFTFIQTITKTVAIHRLVCVTEQLLQHYPLFIDTKVIANIVKQSEMLLKIWLPTACIPVYKLGNISDSTSEMTHFKNVELDMTGSLVCFHLKSSLNITHLMLRLAKLSQRNVSLETPKGKKMTNFSNYIKTESQVLCPVVPDQLLYTGNFPHQVVKNINK